MPPTRKGGKKKLGDGKLNAEDKYGKSLQEIESLKDHLALRKQIARRSQEASEEWKKKMVDAETNLAKQEKIHRAVSADLTRQYKAKHIEQETNLSKLSTELKHSREQLEWTTDELQKIRESSVVMTRERDANIEALNLRISALSGQSETLINDQFDMFSRRLKELSVKWDQKSSALLNETNILLRSHGYDTTALE